MSPLRLTRLRVRSGQVGELWRRLHYLMNRSRLERDLEDEMAAHRAMKADDEPRFGNALRLREESRDVWGWAWWDHLVQDVTFGGRMLRKSPIFTITAISVLALGVGTNIGGFQVLNAMAWRPLPVKDPDSLVRFLRRSERNTSTALSYPAFRFYAGHNSVLTASMAVMPASVAIGDDASREVPVEFVTPNYLSELGTMTPWGRVFDESVDAAPGAEPAIVLSHGLWQRRFGSDPSIVGRTIRVNGRPVTVVGIVSASFVGITGRTPQAWMPIQQQPYAFPGSDVLTNERDAPVAYYGRLKPGLASAVAEAALKETAVALRQLGPDAAWDGEWLQATPAGRFGSFNWKSAPGVLIAAVFTTILLLASCTNLGMLILARNLSRHREISIRLSVGATRRRIVRQLLTESALLSLLGTGLGLVLSLVVGRIAFAGPDSIMQPTLDIRVALFSFAIAGIATVLFGLAPALQSVRPKAARSRTRAILIAGQVATGCTLLVVGGLLVRGMQHVVSTPLGFDYAEHLTISPDLNANGFKPSAARDYFAALRASVERIPDVVGTAAVSFPPLGNGAWTHRLPNGGLAYGHHVDPTYFAVMRIAVVRGRIFAPAETSSMVVSDSFARVLWPGEDPLGKVYGGTTVVGLAADARTIALGDPSATEMYRPMDDAHLPGAVLVVRVRTDPSGSLPAIVAAARSVDARVAPATALLRDGFDRRLRGARQMALVVWVLGMLALALSAIGLAGLLSFSVSQRAREIGIRMALGARSADVVQSILRQFAWPVGCGLAGGLAAAAALSSVLRRELFGLSHLDPVSYIAAAVLFSMVALLAASGPLRRATRVNPVTALRVE
jgi:predicted permease